MIYVWKSFISLHNKRTSNGFGMNPLSYSDMYAYFQLMQMQPEEWEIDTILKLDSVALEHFAKETEKEQKKSKSKGK